MRTTNSTEQSPSWEANSRSGSQEIPHHFWIQMVHYNVHKNPPLVHILIQMNPDYALTIYLFKIHFTIIVYLHIFLAGCFIP